MPLIHNFFVSVYFHILVDIISFIRLKKNKLLDIISNFFIKLDISTTVGIKIVTIINNITTTKVILLLEFI